jgi:hypothetical protein
MLFHFQSDWTNTWFMYLQIYLFMVHFIILTKALSRQHWMAQLINN